MDGSIRLSVKERKRLLSVYRGRQTPALRLRAHLLLLLADGQAPVVTPGNNVKRYLAGSLDWRTGSLLVSPPGTNRNAELFVAHLDELRRRLRCYKAIHVICDNAKFHDCRRVRQFLKVWGHRIQIHFIPTDSPWTNPSERVWWHLHEEITRNHRCRTIEELITMTFQWFNGRQFRVETTRYPTAA